MIVDGVFEAMVRYHIEHNLLACLPYLDGQGVMRPAANGDRPVEEGRENVQYRGQLVFQNGSTLLGHLVDDGYVKNPLDIFDGEEAYHVSSGKELDDFLGGNHGDGVHVYESASDQMVRVAKIEAPDPIFSERLPPHFVHFHRESAAGDLERELRREVGTKTRLALALTQQYGNVRAMQIKQSGYTSLGMGQVVEFDHSGLRRAFFFKYLSPESDPDNIGPFLVPEQRIAGVLRKYKPCKGRIIMEQERLVHPEEYFLDGNETEEKIGEKSLSHPRAA